MEPARIGNYFEDFEKGEVIEHELSKTIFESDNIFTVILHSQSTKHWQFFVRKDNEERRK